VNFSLPKPPADALTRFSSRAEVYVRTRPSYPSEAIDAVFDGLRPVLNVSAADIGAGTGIASRLLAERGVRVTAVEPNEAMRSAAKPDPDGRITWSTGTGEATGLADHSQDLVLCAQAFHWLHADRALAEFQRILKPGGRVALLWNVQDSTDPTTNEYREVLARHATEPPRSPSFAQRPPRPLKDAAGWIDAQLLTFANTQRLDIDGLLGRALSASYSPQQGDARLNMEQDLRSLFETRALNGTVTLRYQTEVHLASSEAHTR